MIQSRPKEKRGKRVHGTRFPRYSTNYRPSHAESQTLSTPSEPELISCPGPTSGPTDGLGRHNPTTPEVNLGTRQQQQRQDNQTPLGNRWDRIDQAITGSLKVSTIATLGPCAGVTLAIRQRRRITRRRAGHSVPGIAAGASRREATHLSAIGAFRPGTLRQ